jgi:H+/Cl- antiporter ClcA
MKLTIGILLSLIAQIITYIQIQGTLRISWMKENKYWLVGLLAIPVAYLLMVSVNYIVAAFGGETWPSRLIGFGVGIVVFASMSYFMFNESITLKTGVCLMLGLVIIILQIFWKG